MNNQKEVVERKEEMSVETLLSQAVSNNVSVETLEKLFALREKVKAEQAKEAFIKALAKFQSEIPVIKKTKKVLNKDGKSVRYMFAPIDSIVEQVKKYLEKNDISYRWETKQEKDTIQAICIVTHSLGHSESSAFEIPVDPEGYMTKAQKFASALTFAKRYSLTNALGISTSDEDLDATDLNKEARAKSPKSKIIFLLKTLNKPTTTKEQIESAVKKMTQLDLVESNYEEIIGRLETIIQQSNEDREIS